jgi:hypothetical protein
MYSGKFIDITSASENTGLPVSNLIRMGLKGELSIYAWDEWFHFDLETPECRFGVDSPILIDDEKYLASLMKGKSITLHIDADDRFICSQDATDDNYLDGVKVTQSDLFCLKSKIEELMHKDSVGTLKTEVKKSISTASRFDDDVLTKRQKQQAAIMEVIRQKGFDRLAIPDREKGTLRTICQHDYPLLFDGDTSFDNAWKGSRALFRMANHASFSKRGKS